MSSLTTARDLVYLKEMCGGRKLPPKSKMSKDQLAALYANGVFKKDALDEGIVDYAKDQYNKARNAYIYNKTRIGRNIRAISDALPVIATGIKKWKAEADLALANKRFDQARTAQRLDALVKRNPRKLKKAYNAMRKSAKDMQEAELRKKIHNDRAKYMLRNTSDELNKRLKERRKELNM